ncbi:hypothetical protein GF327_00660 [Candidatus Woesearchaeota archaeon]|nr:hypothetical protein [Candidatus Woesearchaeota archaeon]
METQTLDQSVLDLIRNNHSTGISDGTGLEDLFYDQLSRSFIKQIKVISDEEITPQELRSGDYVRIDDAIRDHAKACAEVAEEIDLTYGFPGEEIPLPYLNLRFEYYISGQSFEEKFFEKNGKGVNFLKIKATKPGSGYYKRVRLGNDFYNRLNKKIGKFPIAIKHNREKPWRMRNEEHVYRVIEQNHPDILAMDLFARVGDSLVFSYLEGEKLEDFLVSSHKTDRKALSKDLRLALLLGQSQRVASILETDFPGLCRTEYDITGKLFESLDIIAEFFNVSYDKTKLKEACEDFCSGFESDSLAIDCAPRHAVIDLNQLSAGFREKGVYEWNSTLESSTIDFILTKSEEEPDQFNDLIWMIADSVRVYDFDRMGIDVSYLDNLAYLMTDPAYKLDIDGMERALNSVELFRSFERRLPDYTPREIQNILNTDINIEEISGKKTEELLRKKFFNKVYSYVSSGYHDRQRADIKKDFDLDGIETHSFNQAKLYSLYRTLRSFSALVTETGVAHSDSQVLEAIESGNGPNSISITQNALRQFERLRVYAGTLAAIAGDLENHAYPGRSKGYREIKNILKPIVKTLEDGCSSLSTEYHRLKSIKDILGRIQSASCMLDYNYILEETVPLIKLEYDQRIVEEIATKSLYYMGFIKIESAIKDYRKEGAGMPLDKYLENKDFVEKTRDEFTKRLEGNHKYRSIVEYLKNIDDKTVLTEYLKKKSGNNESSDYRENPYGFHTGSNFYLREPDLDLELSQQEISSMQKYLTQ